MRNRDHVHKVLRAAGAAGAFGALLLLGTAPSLGSPEAQRPPRTLTEQSRDPSLPSDDDGLTPKQQRDLLKHNFEKLKEDVAELFELASQLNEEVKGSSENVLSLEVVEKASKIEKLAKRVKEKARRGR
jgi:hypothetical protein